MSARIHEIAKQYNVEPKDMLSWLKEQGYVAADTKSVSSTVSKIYYDEIEKKYGKPAAPAPVAAPAPAAPAPIEEPKIKLPPAVLVKSAQDIAREEEGAPKAPAAARAPLNPPTPAPVASPKLPPAPTVKAPPLP